MQPVKKKFNFVETPVLPYKKNVLICMICKKVLGLVIIDKRE